ncbi:MAG TPA: hypothetical protein VGX68_17310 [Thermoanaerobaculia bacterium]|jgi:hypothetical protein|nr:hypothetical protein [Thermoanaerobaculia bacterium]
MRGRKSFAAFALIAAAFVTGSLAAAQQMAAPKWYVMHQELAKPSMLKQYEDVSKEFIATVRQHHEAIPAFNFVGVAGDDYVYTYVTEIKGFSDVEAIFAGFAKLSQAVGEAKWNDLMVRGGQTMEWMRDSILMEDPSFSYTPAQPRLKPEEEQYLHVDLYYVQPGREVEADAICKEFAALFRKKNVPDRYRVFKVVMGWEMPLIIVITPAKSPADYEALVAQSRKLLGAEGQALFARAFAITRHFEMHGGTIRPDLSLEPFAKK